MKTCIECGKRKQLSEFRKYARSKDGRQGVCKSCMKKREVKYRADNADKLKENWDRHYAKNSEVIKRRAKDWEKDNREHVKKRKKEYADRNRAQRAEYSRQYYADNLEKKREYMNNYRKERRKVDPNFQCVIDCQRIIHRVIRQTTSKKDGLTIDLLGYTASDLKAHLESLFEPGMSWENRGEWHIDHIKPVVQFIREGVTDPAVINALSNLQPLWAADNLTKGSALLDKDGNVIKN